MSDLIYDSVESYVNAFYRPLSEELGRIREYGDGNNFSLIMKDTEALLSSLLRIARPERILEIGTSIGYSASLFATLLPSAHIDTLERDMLRYEAALENFRALGLDGRIRAYLGDAAEYLESFAEEGREKYDFIFIDAAKSHYREFWDMSEKLLAGGGIIACDNLLFKAKVANEPELPGRKHRTSVSRLREFTRYISGLEGFDTRLFAIGDGLSISIKL